MKYKIKLIKDWGPHKKGEIVELDYPDNMTLVFGGYGKIVKE